MTPMEPMNTDKALEAVDDGTPRVVMVALDPDVAGVFSNSQSVNEALRLLIKVAKRAQELAKAS